MKAANKLYLGSSKADKEIPEASVLQQGFWWEGTALESQIFSKVRISETLVDINLPPKSGGMEGAFSTGY